MCLCLITEPFYTCFVVRSSTTSSSRGSGSHCKPEGQEEALRTHSSEQTTPENEETSKIRSFSCNGKVPILLMATIELNGSLSHTKMRAECNLNTTLFFSFISKKAKRITELREAKNYLLYKTNSSCQLKRHVAMYKRN